MATGAINVVRGTRSSNEELLQIYNHSERLVRSSFLYLKFLNPSLMHEMRLLNAFFVFVLGFFFLH